MEILSRVGYIVHVAIYLVIGTLAARLAWGTRGELADPPPQILPQISHRALLGHG
jgi:hypothetical protein